MHSWSGRTTHVAPFVGAWIEMHEKEQSKPKYIVAPFVGAWIEIRQDCMAHQVAASLRSSERGLKFVRSTDADAVLTSLRSSERGLKCQGWRTLTDLAQSLRSSERGLKSIIVAKCHAVIRRSVRRSVD